MSDEALEQAISTLKSLDVGSSGEKENDTCKALKFDGQYRLKRLLREYEHADVYSVWSVLRKSSIEGLEARVYSVEDVPDKLRKYRLRSIKRLSSRTILQFRRDGLVVVVYKVDGASGEGSKNEVQRDTSPENDLQGEEMEKSKPKQKSNYQRESARLRQLERRKLNRRKEEQKKAESSQSDKEASMNEAQEATDEEDAFYVLLHLAYNDRPQLRQQLPPASRDVLQKYLRVQPLKFEDGDEIEAFVEIKLRELLFLRRQEKKLPGIEKRRKSEYANILKQQFLLTKGSDEYKPMQNEVTIAQHKLRVIRHVQQILPKVIGDADKIHRNLKQRLKLVREKKTEIERLQTLNAERDKLKREVVFYEKVSQEVVPGSRPYAKTVSQLQAVEEELKRFDARLKGGLMNRLELLKEDYKHLLAAPVQNADVLTIT